MRALSVTILFLGVNLFAQTRPGLTGSFGNVVFPGSTAAQPGVHRSFGNVAFPGTGGPKVNIPFSITDPTFGARLGSVVSGQRNTGYPVNGNFRRNHSVAIPVAVPVYVGGSYDVPY